jgi:hypothetical protein
MRHLTNNELAAVSAGDLTCTVGTGGINCSGSTKDWGAFIDAVADAVKEFFSDLFG